MLLSGRLSNTTFPSSSANVRRLWREQGILRTTPDGMSDFQLCSRSREENLDLIPPWDGRRTHRECRPARWKLRLATGWSRTPPVVLLAPGLGKNASGDRSGHRRGRRIYLALWNAALHPPNDAAFKATTATIFDVQLRCYSLHLVEVRVVAALVAFHQGFASCKSDL